MWTIMCVCVCVDTVKTFFFFAAHIIILHYASIRHPGAAVDTLLAFDLSSKTRYFMVVLLPRPKVWAQVSSLNSLLHFQQRAAFWAKVPLFFFSSAFALFWHWWRETRRAGREGHRSDTNHPVVLCTWEQSGGHFPADMTSEQIKLQIYY